MIDFKCQCGHQFSEPEDHAGLEFQCPQCLRLVDVPRLSDLAAIAPDGTYVLTHPAPPTEGAIPGIDDVVYSFRRGTIDAQGAEIDLRHDNESLANVGSLSLGPLDSVVAPLPRYDPETGELLTPVDITPHVVRPIPIIDPKAASTLKYAVGATDPHAIHIWRVPRELLRLPNLAVMGFSFFCQIMLAACGVVMYLLFPIGLVALIIFTLIAHYGSVPHEIGYKELDDLPRPLGDLNWNDDVFAPFGNLIMSLILSYFPLIFGMYRLGNVPATRVLLLALFGAGSVVFPAIFLTMTNGGSLFNLRPDRVIGVMRETGWFYLVLVIEWVVVAPLYLLASGFLVIVAHQLVHFHLPRWWLPIALTAVAVAIYALFIFLWQLGLAYRKWGDQYPWIFQLHMRQSK
jgi:hypothetical protein